MASVPLSHRPPPPFRCPYSSKSSARWPCSAAAVTAAIFHQRAALACPLVISCNRSTLSSLFKVSAGKKVEERRGKTDAKEATEKPS